MTAQWGFRTDSDSRCRTLWTGRYCEINLRLNTLQRPSHQTSTWASCFLPAAGTIPKTLRKWRQGREQNLLTSVVPDFRKCRTVNWICNRSLPPPPSWSPSASPEGLWAGGALCRADLSDIRGGRVQHAPARLHPHDWQHVIQWAGLWSGSRLLGGLPQGQPIRTCVQTFIVTVSPQLPVCHQFVLVVFQLHLCSLSQDTVAMAALLRLSSRLEAGWAELRTSFDQSLCLLSYAKSALLWHVLLNVIKVFMCLFSFYFLKLSVSEK